MEFARYIAMPLKSRMVKSDPHKITTDNWNVQCCTIVVLCSQHACDLADHQQVQETSRQSAQPELLASMQQRNLGECNVYKACQFAEVIDFTLCMWTKLSAVRLTHNQVQACQTELGIVRV